MTGARVLAVTVFGVILSGYALRAQDLSNYRSFTLGSSIESVAKTKGVRPSDTKVVHQRPALIQELQWRPPYMLASESATPDPVQDVVFSFYNDQLFRIVITYDRDRTSGMTSEDVVEALSAAYGTPVLSSGRSNGTPPRAGAWDDSVTVARWQDGAQSLTLFRAKYPDVFRLVIVSTTLDALATASAAEALRLDTKEAPQREIDRRKKDVLDARAVQQKARLVNKAAFRP